jgi:hypothetical protein
MEPQIVSTGVESQNSTPQGQEPNFESFVKEQFGHESTAVKEMISQLPTLRAQIQQYEAEKQISPFANPFAEKINSLFKEGASPEHVLKFAQIQSMDFEKMNPEALIRTHLQLKNSVLNAEDIELLIEDKLGSLPDKDEYPEEYARAVRMREIKAKLEAEEAKKYLTSQKSELEKISNPENEQRRALESSWGQVLETSIKDVPVIDLNIEFEDGGKYSLPEGYKPKINPEQMTAIRQNVLKSLVAQGVPLNEAGMQKANEMVMFSVRVLSQDDILKTVISDVAASVEQAIYSKLNTK